MFKLIQRYCYRIWYALPFTMKAGDLLTSSNKDDEGNKTTVNKVVEHTNLGEDLLKGEVTQAVEDLRYSTYKVSEESRKYKYVGEGEVVKQITPVNGKLNITQYNSLFGKTVLDVLKTVGGQRVDDDKFTLSIEYVNTPKFRLERYCKFIALKKEENGFILDLEFDSFADKGDVTSRYFVQELKKPLKYSSLVEPLSHASFITYKATGQEDLFKYDLYNLKFKQLYNSYDWVHLVFTIEKVEEEDLKLKYYSKHQQDRYDNKEQKGQEVTFSENEEKYYCDICGAEMNKYDYDITLTTYNKGMCNKCLEKLLGQQDESNRN